MSPKLAYLCLFENPTADAGRALTRQFVLVREADRMGYDEIWIGEHHNDDVWPTAAATALLGYAAGVTTHARIGSMALLPAYRDPVLLAEDVATLDQLSKGRFNLGVSRGASFAPQRAQFSRPDDHQRALEALELIQRLLSGDEVSFAGAYFRTASLRLVPRPAQPRVPTWIASAAPELVRHAAAKDYGLMATATATAEDIRERLRLYRKIAPQNDPRLVLARFAYVAPTRDEALAVARPYLEAFAARMRTLGIEPEPGGAAVDDPEALLAMSLVGSYAEVAEQITRLQAEVSAHSIAIVPTSAQFDTVKRCLADFVDEVRPLLSDG